MVLKYENINESILASDLRNLIHDDYPCYFIKKVVDLINCSKVNKNFVESLCSSKIIA